jgi:hypothetical protein
MIKFELLKFSPPHRQYTSEVGATSCIIVKCAGAKGAR